MKFKIPREFELAGQTISVVQTPDIGYLSRACGMSKFDDGLIVIDPTLKGDIKPITFYHEMVHFILNQLGRYELCQDEGFVDSFANLLWQSIKTAKY